MDERMDSVDLLLLLTVQRWHLAKAEAEQYDRFGQDLQTHWRFFGLWANCQQQTLHQMLRKEFANSVSVLRQISSLKCRSFVEAGIQLQSEVEKVVAQED